MIKTELTTVNCPLTSTPSLWHTETHTYTMASIAMGKTGTWTGGSFYTGLWVYFRKEELLFFFSFPLLFI